MRDLVDPTRSGSFLLELLYFAGWRLEVRRGDPTRIRARRGEIVLDVSRPTLAHAAGVVFARAMRSGSSAANGRQRPAA